MDKGNIVIVGDPESRTSTALALRVTECGATPVTWQRSDEQSGDLGDLIHDRAIDGLVLFTQTDPIERADIFTLDLHRWHERVVRAVTAVFEICCVALPAMVRQRHGSIVIVGPTDRRTTRGADNAAADGAIATLVKCVATEFSRYQIRINAIEPVRDRHEVRAELRDDSDDMAALIEFLLSDEAAYINGQVLHG